MGTGKDCWAERLEPREKKKKTVAQWAHRRDSPLQTMQAGNLWLQQIACTNPAEWGRKEISPESHNAAPAWATGHDQAY